MISGYYDVRTATIIITASWNKVPYGKKLIGSGGYGVRKAAVAHS
jgi:hypothetical protein